MLTWTTTSDDLLTTAAVPDSFAGEEPTLGVVMLRLSSELKDAVLLRPILAAVLMEAWANALEHLLLFGKREDIEALEEWLQGRSR